MCCRAKWEGILSEISILWIHFIIPNTLVNVFLFFNFSLSHFILILSLPVAFYALIGIFMKHFANSDHFLLKKKHGEENMKYLSICICLILIIQNSCVFQ